ncbi:MAG: hypothetical protein ACI32A_01220, partial [Floccifex sp.]
MEVQNMCEIMEEIRESGRLEGLVQGEAKGKAEGISIGKLEEKMKIAYKLKIEGMSEEKIASFVECSIFQVKEWLSKSNDCLL